MNTSGEYIWSEQINKEIERNINNLDIILDKYLKESDKGKEVIRIIESYSVLRK